MKKFFRKLTATALAQSLLCAIHTSIIFVEAANTPSYTLTFPRGSTIPVDEQIEEFISIAPGIFCVDPNFKNPAKANPYTVYRVIRQITKIFKMYPNITRKFIEEINCTKDKKFELKLLSGEFLDQQLKPFIPDQINTTGLYLATEEKIRIFINCSHINRVESDTKLRAFIQSVITDEYDDYAEYAITHETGHLFAALIRFCTDKSLFFKSIAAANILSELAWALHSPETCPLDQTTIEEYIAELTQYTNAVKIINANFKSDIIQRAVKEWGYIGDGFIDIHGETNAEEWLAQVFANAICSKTPTALSKALLSRLDDIEKHLIYT